MKALLQLLRTLPVIVCLFPQVGHSSESKGLRASELAPVCRVLVETKVGLTMVSGALVGPQNVLTNALAFRSPADIIRASVECGYKGFSVEKKTTVQTRKGSILIVGGTEFAERAHVQSILLHPSLTGKGMTDDSKTENEQALLILNKALRIEPLALNIAGDRFEWRSRCFKFGFGMNVNGEVGLLNGGRLGVVSEAGAVGPHILQAMTRFASKVPLELMTLAPMQMGPAIVKGLIKEAERPVFNAPGELGESDTVSSPF